MKKVVVGMSGGVDSSVAALLLKKQGYEVIGLFMRNWDATLNNDIEGNPTLNNNICPQEQDYNDALKVCQELDIPLHRVDFIKEYWDNVFTYFLDELKKGRTPNPDLMCNKYIKFDVFIKEARKLGADYIATGHYARTNNSKLLRGLDQNKDQSYFLAQLTPNQLKDVLFPVGELTKVEVRKIALENNLYTAKKKDSTGICFIGERHYQEFISNYLKPNPGDIVDVETKEVIGRHTGLMNYTIGQRRNVGIAGNDKKHFVCGKDVEKNILYVSFGEDNEYLYSDACLIEQVNLISPTAPTFCTAKFRYRGQDHPVSVEYLDDNQALVRYHGKAKSVTPGQACVLYLGEQCIGSGIIKEVYKNNQKLWYL
ncbi:MAG TPA: tRNA 2-thiouridine(34) synthase MnmA [Bacilli bacterium]|jgi:tRNA (5-methylaminomethyl-2-thiouridylate)-methyltransferase|nr:tRNA 2-thiouridine(34) synthase MnmA [Bacilli bacterium]